MLHDDPRPAPSWARETGLEPVLRGWLRSGSVRPCLAADREIPGAALSDAPMPDLEPGLVDALRARGIERLYAHQARAVEAARAGRHVVVATPTASGKSLCFHLPVLQALADEPGARALYLYPTKALSRDQEAGLRELMKAAGLAGGAVVYDGDTPGD